jgi:acyl carrier protein
MSTPPSADTIRTALREFILSNFLFTDDQSALNDRDSFQDTRIIDSMGMIQVIQFIEGEYRLKVLDAEMVPEKLDSVERLTRFILDKKGLA